MPITHLKRGKPDSERADDDAKVRAIVETTLRDIETRAESGKASRDETLAALNELDRVANGIAVPLAHVDEVYALRNNIHAARKRLLAQGASSETDRPDAAQPTAS